MVESIKNMTMPLGERLAKIDANLASVRLDKNKFFDLIVDAGYVDEDGFADVKKFNRAAKRAGIDVKDRSQKNLQKITKFLNLKSGGAYKNVAKFSAKSIAENAASQSEGFLGKYAEKYSAATKEDFWKDAKKLQRKVNPEKISSLDKAKKIARGLKLKWAVPIGVTTTLLSKMGFGAMGHLITTEMGDAELPTESMAEQLENMDFSGPSANSQLLEQLSQDAAMSKRGGGMASMDDMTRPLGYLEGGPVPRSRQQSLAEEEAGQDGLRNLIKNYISNIRKNAFAPKQYEGGDDPEYMNKFNFLWKQGYDSQQIDAILSGQVDPTEIVPARKNLDEEFKG